uniref:Putative proline-rich receptor-like protein kinase perk15-like isoform 2 n=1 Tax=Amblyomma tuberculatum TaxID=48802 RepID=A0A6M2E474_9ACAR
MRSFASLVVLLALEVASVSSYVLPTLAPHPLGGCPKQERPSGDRHCNFWCRLNDGRYSEDRYEDGLECDFGSGSGVCYGGLCHAVESVRRYGKGTGGEPNGQVPAPAPEAPPPEVPGQDEVTVMPPESGETPEEPPQHPLPALPEQPPEQLPEQPTQDEQVPSEEESEEEEI